MRRSHVSSVISLFGQLCLSGLLFSATSHSFLRAMIVRLSVALLLFRRSSGRWVCSIFVLFTVSEKSFSNVLDAEHMRTIEVPLSSLRSVENKGVRSLTDIGVFAVRGGQLLPIAYQIDERQENGLVYVDGVSDRSKSVGIGYLDPSDHVLFVWRDAGPKWQETALTEGRVIAEFEVTNGEELRYVYLVEKSRLKSRARYVRYSAEFGQVDTGLYRLNVNPKNALMWDRFEFTPYKGKELPIDTFKLRLQSGVVLPFVKTKLNNRHIVAKLKGQKVGPIRATAHYKVRVKVAGIPLMSIVMQVHHEYSRMLYDVRMRIPPIRRAMVIDPALHLFWDGHDLFGAEISVLADERLTGVADGVMTQMEDQIKDLVIKENNGIWMDTKRDMQWLLRFIPANTDDKKGDRASREVAYLYHDDAALKDRPENYNGVSPGVGFSILEFPRTGAYDFRISLDFLSQREQFTVEQVIEQVVVPPSAKVTWF